MSSPSKASHSNCVPEKDNDVSVRTWLQRPESDKDTESTSHNSQSNDTESANTSSGDTPSENNTTEENDETDKALTQEELDDSAEFSQLIDALIEWQIHETEANYQRSHICRRDLFAQHMHEEALILDSLAGPNATAAERKEVADEAAAVRQRLAGQSIESVAESVARDKPRRDTRRARRRAARAVCEAKRKADEYEQELASMRRLVEFALENPDDLPGALGVFQRMALEPLRQTLQSPYFLELKDKTGSFDNAVKSLFDVKWSANKPAREAMRKEKMKQLKEEKKRLKEETGRSFGKLFARGRSKSG